VEGPLGKPLKPHTPVRSGETFELSRLWSGEPEHAGSAEQLHVLFEDEDLLVVDKPARLAMHPTARYYHGTLTRLLAERYPGQPLQIAHRLDRETSGCVVVGKHRAAAIALKRTFAGRHVEKTYLAVVVGVPPWEVGQPQTVDIPLALARPHESRLRIRMVDATGRPEALASQTELRLVSAHGDVALVECRPHTGRQHQIRAHLALLGYPIAGDRLYGHGDEAFIWACECEDRGDATAELTTRFGLPRQALHAAAITLPHPTPKTPLHVEAPLPPDLVEFLRLRE
jgi:23S rRNA pseudouridine1911/1915/1917 synthase